MSATNVELILQRAFQCRETAMAVEDHSAWVGVNCAQESDYPTICRLLHTFSMPELTLALVWPERERIIPWTDEIGELLSSGDFDALALHAFRVDLGNAT